MGERGSGTVLVTAAFGQLSHTEGACGGLAQPPCGRNGGKQIAATMVHVLNEGVRLFSEIVHNFVTHCVTLDALEVGYLEMHLFL